MSHCNGDNTQFEAYLYTVYATSRKEHEPQGNVSDMHAKCA